MRSFVLALTLASATVAAAQPAADDLAEARGAFEAGQSAYRAGRFEDALGSFRLAFSITDAPEILFNIATVLDRLRRDDEALSAYRTFLELRPDTPERANIEGRIQALERAREREQRERAAEEAAALARVNTAAAEAARQAFEEAEAQRAPAGPGAGPWVVGGIGGALVLASGVFFGLYFADASTVEDVESPSRFEDIQDAYARAPVYAGVGWSTAIGGALILGSAIAWAALAGGRDSEEGQGSVALVVGPAHLGLCGSFR
jgi:tetratricopeptide (TPR) repeat protein